MNTESIMSVEKQVEVDKVDDNIVEVGEVEVISDLDLLEVATLDYKLSGYRPLTVCPRIIATLLYILTLPYSYFMLLIIPMIFERITLNILYVNNFKQKCE